MDAMRTRAIRVADMLARRHVSPEIIDRVLRLNPNPQEGVRLRGLHRYSSPCWEYDWVSKGAFVREFGREAWSAMPIEEIRKRGKRAFVTREAVLDRVWKRH